MSTNQFIKRAYSESEYTPELIQQLKKCQNDPVYFIRNYVYLQHPTRGKILFNLYDYQEELIHACQNNKRVIALISRQMGKCVSGSTLIHTCRKPNKLKMWLLRLIDNKEYLRAKELFNL